MMRPHQLVTSSSSLHCQTILLSDVRRFYSCSWGRLVQHKYLRYLTGEDSEYLRYLGTAYLRNYAILSAVKWFAACKPAVNSIFLYIIFYCQTKHSAGIFLCLSFLAAAALPYYSSWFCLRLLSHIYAARVSKISFSPKAVFLLCSFFCSCNFPGIFFCVYIAFDCTSFLCIATTINKHFEIIMLCHSDWLFSIHTYIGFHSLIMLTR